MYFVGIPGIPGRVLPYRIRTGWQNDCNHGIAKSEHTPDLDIHLADFPVHIPFLYNRIQPVQERCHRFPHCHPSDDEEPLRYQGIEQGVSGIDDDVTDQETDNQECSTDNETYFSYPVFLPELTIQGFSPVPEMIPDGEIQGLCCFGFCNSPGKVDDQAEIFSCRIVVYRGYDILLGIAVKSFLVEGSWIKGVEQLHDIREFEFYRDGVVTLCCSFLLRNPYTFRQALLCYVHDTSSWYFLPGNPERFAIQ